MKNSLLVNSIAQTKRQHYSLVETVIYEETKVFLFGKFNFSYAVHTVLVVICSYSEYVTCAFTRKNSRNFKAANIISYESIWSRQIGYTNILFGPQFCFLGTLLSKIKVTCSATLNSESSWTSSIFHVIVGFNY
jgi:hypothetical protein